MGIDKGFLYPIKGIRLQLKQIAPQMVEATLIRR